jgi:hypothetical protein
MDSASTLPLVHGILACDSRGRDFINFPVINNKGYVPHTILRRGAHIKALENEIILMLDGFPRHHFSIVYVIAGICELTYKIYHADGQELDIRPLDNLCNNIASCKKVIRDTYPNTIVCFATIPTIKFKKVVSYNIEHGKLSASKFSLEELGAMQDILDSRIKEVNEFILEENKAEQIIVSLGPFRPSNLFLHQNVTKLVVRKKGNKRLRSFRINESALIDGIHANIDISHKWYEALHSSYLKYYQWINSSTKVRAYTPTIFGKK